MELRRLALRIAPPSIFSLLLACAGGEQGATGATSAATTGETTTGSISASSTDATDLSTDATDPSTDATDATTVTTGEATTGPGGCMKDSDCLKVAGVAYREALEGICGDADGWRYVDPKLEQIELCGAACEQAQVAGVLYVEYRCPSASSGGAWSRQLRGGAAANRRPAPTR